MIYALAVLKLSAQRIMNEMPLRSPARAPTIFTFEVDYDVDVMSVVMWLLGLVV